MLQRIFVEIITPYWTMREDNFGTINYDNYIRESHVHMLKFFEGEN